MALLLTGTIVCVWGGYHIGEIVSATGDTKNTNIYLNSLTPRLDRSHEVKWTEWTLQPRVHQVSDSLQGKISTAS